MNKDKSIQKKEKQLGMSIGKAGGILRKLILFDLVKKLNLNICYRCKLPIIDIDTFSIEHMIPYLDAENPIELFFDLNNISFSHFKCNALSHRMRTGVKHPSHESYRRGCRCNECRKIEKLRARKYRAGKKLKQSSPVV